MLYLIDNYDSFTYNLVQYLAELGTETIVRLHDEASIEEIERCKPDALLISPGPGTPDDSGRSLSILQHFFEKMPILGVCLGHQCIGALLGAKVIRAPRPVHGKTSEIYHDQKTIFEGIQTPMPVGRYHSLIIEEESLPKEAEVSARTSAGEVMAMRVRGTRVEGVQFHPESILTPDGKQLLSNFLSQLA
jgi:para-aminobenzoate synthetase component 2